MEVVRAIRPKHFWEYLKDHIPSGLVASGHVTYGYGYRAGIYLRQPKQGWFRRGDLVAEVREIFDESEMKRTGCKELLELNDPAWLSDFTDVIERYESIYGRKVKVVVWQSEKDVVCEKR